MKVALFTVYCHYTGKGSTWMVETSSSERMTMTVLSGSGTIR